MKLEEGNPAIPPIVLELDKRYKKFNRNQSMREKKKANNCTDASIDNHTLDFDEDFVKDIETRRRPSRIHKFISASSRTEMMSKQRRGTMIDPASLVKPAPPRSFISPTWVMDEDTIRDIHKRRRSSIMHQDRTHLAENSDNFTNRLDVSLALSNDDHIPHNIMADELDDQNENQGTSNICVVQDPSDISVASSSKKRRTPGSEDDINYNKAISQESILDSSDSISDRDGGDVENAQDRKTIEIHYNAGDSDVSLIKSESNIEESYDEREEYDRTDEDTDVSRKRV